MCAVQADWRVPEVINTSYHKEGQFCQYADPFKVHLDQSYTHILTHTRTGDNDEYQGGQRHDSLMGRRPGVFSDCFCFVCLVCLCVCADLC